MNVNWNSKRMQGATALMLGAVLDVGVKQVGLSVPGEAITGLYYGGAGLLAGGVVDQVFSLSPSKRKPVSG